MFRCSRIIPHHEKKVKEVETLLLLTSYIERQKLPNKHTQYETLNNFALKAQDLGQAKDAHFNVAQNHIFVL
jgi:hypothetical protein